MTPAPYTLPLRIRKSGESFAIDDANGVRDQRSTRNADLPKLGKSERAFADQATDFTPPIYNIWKQQEKTPGVSHFGNSEVRWV